MRRERCMTRIDEHATKLKSANASASAIEDDGAVQCETHLDTLAPSPPYSFAMQRHPQCSSLRQQRGSKAIAEATADAHPLRHCEGGTASWRWRRVGLEHKHIPVLVGEPSVALVKTPSSIAPNGGCVRRPIGSCATRQPCTSEGTLTQTPRPSPP